MGLIVFIVPISNVIAAPAETSEVPYTIRTLYGTKVSGTVEDVQNFDGDSAHWKGTVYWIFWPDGTLGPTWIMEPALYYAHPGFNYQHVYLAVKFKYSGNYAFDITVHYGDGTHDDFVEYPTGGSFVMKYYTLDNYKAVSYISFRASDDWLLGSQQHIYIDCAEVTYTKY